MDGRSPTEALADAARRRVWGTLVVHLRDGEWQYLALREVSRPSDAPALADVAGREELVRAALAQGDDVELIYVRIRGGQLRSLAVENHSNRKDGHHVGRIGGPGETDPEAIRGRGPGGDIHPPAQQAAR